MKKYSLIKVGLLAAFCLLYCLSYWPSAAHVAARATREQNQKPDQQKSDQQKPDQQNQPAAIKLEPAAVVATPEFIAKKYGSLDRIPIHQVHAIAKVVDADGKEKKLECLDCHATPEGTTGPNSVRYLAPVQCNACHIEDNDERQKYPQPPLPTGRESLAEYSHAAHIDPLGRFAPSGQRQDCTHCHNPGVNMVTMPTHSQCYSCHSGPKAAKPAFDGQTESCRGCHSEVKIDRNIIAPKEGRAENPLLVSAHASYRDLKRINHNAHLKEPDGAVIACLQCHSGMLRKSSIDQFAQLPTMNDCAICHANLHRTSTGTQMENCSLCHKEVTTTLMPFTTAFDNNPGIIRSQTSDRQIPIDHTATFRINHQQQARQPDNRCAACHTGVDKIGDDNCANCHNVMKPRSHQPPRFKDIDHGRFAAMSRSSCATCHNTEFCARCHNQLPRDHEPLGIFAGGTHKFQARANMRACLTCHTYEHTCEPCHVADADGPSFRRADVFTNRTFTDSFIATAAAVAKNQAGHKTALAKMKSLDR